MNKRSFPLGVAEGKYFCNRLIETKQMLGNIEKCLHTVLISPRRYGKTSLAYRAIEKSKLPYARVDLYMAASALDIEKAIISGVDQLLSAVSNNAEALLGLIKNFVKSLRPSFEMSENGLKIKLETVNKTPSATNICEALQILDEVLKKKKMQAVLLLDEFQEVQQAAPNQGIEGAIRHVAQETKNFTLIFSGSHRHLLKNIFNDRNKPLYRLCDEIHLDRIHKEDYQPFINKFAQNKWQKKLSNEVFNQIFSYTEMHPYYINALCEKLFTKETLPTEADVIDIWKQLIMIKRRDVLGETKDLNIVHKKILVSIAHGSTSEFTGRKFLSENELSGATVTRALEYLEDDDFIEKKENHYFFIDPLLKSMIKELTYF